MYEIRMQWILTWNEMKLHMHQYDVCRTNDCRYANVCKSQPLLDSYHKIFLSKLWTLQNYLFNSISQQSSECLFDVTDLLMYFCMKFHNMRKYSSVVLLCMVVYRLVLLFLILRQNYGQNLQYSSKKVEALLSSK